MASHPSVEYAAVRGRLSITLNGTWCIGSQPDSRAGLRELRNQQHMLIRVASDTQWDSSLPAFIVTLVRAAQMRNIAFELDTPPRLSALLELALRSTDSPAPDASQARWRLPDLRAVIGFIGALLLALRPVRALPQRREILRILRQTSSQSLPIVALVNFLVGGILAFIGAVQLRTFGAEIFVADLVAIATAREMAALITAVVLSGRIAAAFAAEIATMQGNEEIDALRTSGVDPVRYLALPRVVALLLATPVLFVTAAIMTLTGGLTVAWMMLDIPVFSYVLQTREAVGLDQFGIGMAKALCFSIFLAGCGCYHGLQVARTAAAVGDATTRAVVSSMVGIICIDALFAVILNALGL